MDSPDIVWRPDPETASRTRIARFMQQHGCASLEALQQRSVEISHGTGMRSRGPRMALVHAYQQVVTRLVVCNGRAVCGRDDESGGELC